MISSAMSFFENSRLEDDWNVGISQLWLSRRLSTDDSPVSRLQTKPSSSEYPHSFPIVLGGRESQKTNPERNHAWNARKSTTSIVATQNFVS